MGDMTPRYDQPRAVGANDAGFMRRLSGLLQRANLSGLFGQVFGGKRDYYDVFGYDRQLDSTKMWEMYYRGGIAHRIIHAYPDAVWARPPQLYVQDQPDWNTSWDKFAETIGLWQAIKKADILAGLGRYACILVGTTSGNLQSPMRKGSTITYLQPYSEQNMAISEWERDPTNPRFGMPKFYTVYPNRNRNSIDVGNSTTAPVASSFRVHASRVIHITRGSLESPVFGVPRYAPIWNYLYDLMKIVGSSAESYWMTAYQGLHVDVDSEMEMEEADAQDLSDEVDEYQHGLRRVIRTRGTTVKTLGSKVADPRGAFDVVLTLISGSTGLPKRVLLGSESGQLASSQDKGNWAERVEEERENHAEPDIIRPIMHWLKDYGIFDTPDLTLVQVLWPEAYRMSPLERGQTAAQTARTVANLAKGMEPIITKKGTPATPDIMGPDGTVVTPGDPGTPDEQGDALLTREEARKLIGLSTDQQALIEKPE